MERNTKIVILLVGAAALIIAGILLVARQRGAARTEAAVATVVSAEREEKRGDDDTILVLAWDVGGRRVEGRARVDGVVTQDFPSGTPVPICYDPARPASVAVAEGACAE